MEDLLTNFSHHLEMRCNFLESYLQALEEQAEFVATGNIEKINHNTSLILQLSQENKKLERIGQSQLKELAKQLQISVDKITISNLIPKLNSEWSKKLSYQKERLVAIVIKIQRQLETNSFLMRFATHFVHDLISLNDKALKSDLVYSKKGIKDDRRLKKKILDQKI